MSNKARIVVVGSLVFDFVARAIRLPNSGETLLGDFFGMFPGGKGANQAVQAGRLGADVHMVGCVGDDFPGERLLNSLRENGVATQLVRRDATARTAACCIHVDAHGNNAIVMVPEANAACSVADVEAAREWIALADVLLLQLEIPLDTVARAIQIAGEHEIPVILNPAPAQVLPPEFLSRITVLTPNEIEAEMMSGLNRSGRTSARAWENQAAGVLRQRGAPTVIITLAERGAHLTTEGLEAVVPTFAVQAVDSTAAGDAFNGALAVALAEGRGILDATRFANAAGALATTKPGAQPSLAGRADVEALMRAGSSPLAVLDESTPG